MRLSNVFAARPVYKREKNNRELHDNIGQKEKDNTEKEKEEDKEDREVDDSGNEGDISYVTIFVVHCPELRIHLKPPITVYYSRVLLLLIEL